MGQIIKKDTVSGKNINVQYLRGIGIIAIILYHFPMFYKLPFIDYCQKFVRFGQANELFFVIAGYFLAKQCLIEEWNLKLAYKFLKRRIRRLIIPLFFWGGTAALTGIYIGKFSVLQGLSWLLATITFAQNVYNSYYPNSFGYTWFIACEMQFFLIIVLILFMKNYNRVMAVLFLMLLSLTFFHPHVRTNLFFEFHGLIVGMFLYELLNKYTVATKIINCFKEWQKKFIVFFMILAGLAVSKIISSDISFTTSAILFSVAFSMMIQSDKPIYTSAEKVIKEIGDVSYSIYLCHIPIILLLNELLAGSFLYQISYLYFFVVMAVIFLTGFLSGKYIEKI